MARRELEIIVTQSLLDRLTDRSRDKDSKVVATGDELKTRSESLRQFEESVKRDIEWLLNTRQTAYPAREDLSELHKSLYNYGLPDIASRGLHSPRDRERLRSMLETTLRRFEARISGVKVSLQPTLTDSHVLHFRIDGMLRVDPAPEPVSFNTLLEIVSGQYEVK